MSPAITERDLDVLKIVAVSVGRDPRNFEATDIEIVEMVLDIAAGNPHNLLGIHSVRSALVEQYIVENFWKGMRDA